MFALLGAFGFGMLAFLCCRLVTFGLFVGHDTWLAGLLDGIVLVAAIGGGVAGYYISARWFRVVILIVAGIGLLCGGVSILR
jgi:hypothetical protein